MTKEEAIKELQLIPDKEGCLTLAEAASVIFTVDETEWILKYYNKPEGRSLTDRGPENNRFPQYTDEYGMSKYCTALDLVLAMNRFRIDEDIYKRIFDMAYRTTVMDLAVKFGIKHTGTTIADFKPDEEDALRFPQYQELIRNAETEMELFKDQMAIDHVLWSFPGAFSMTIEDVIKHRADEPQRLCGAGIPRERYDMVQTILEGTGISNAAPSSSGQRIKHISGRP
ncbi:MAG: hypothetical protein K6C99_07940 [Lachnospiraceae bacterium]|nr:hypothetical protein [Lachnospiraceae bacterium]